MNGSSLVSYRGMASRPKRSACLATSLKPAGPASTVAIGRAFSTLIFAGWPHYPVGEIERCLSEGRLLTGVKFEGCGSPAISQVFRPHAKEPGHFDHSGSCLKGFRRGSDSLLLCSELEETLDLAGLHRRLVKMRS